MKKSAFDTSFPNVAPVSESAVAVTFGDTINLETHRKVIVFRDSLLAQPFPGMISAVPAYTSVTVFFDPLKIRTVFREKHRGLSFFSPVRIVCESINKILKTSVLNTETENVPAPKTLEIPVLYNGPDLPEVADRLGLSENEVIRLHSEVVYTVFMTGFLPGFPYLGPLPAALELPRRDSPRLRVPAGSVAIAGRQTGIYPQSSPGGWHLIGSTDFPLFNPGLQPPARLQPGMQVRFVNTVAVPAAKT